MPVSNNIKPVKRLNAMLPDALGLYVGAMTSEGGEYETPSEYIRDLIRRDMRNTKAQETHEVAALLKQALAENSYSDWSPQDTQTLREKLKE